MLAQFRLLIQTVGFSPVNRATQELNRFNGLESGR